MAAAAPVRAVEAVWVAAEAEVLAAPMVTWVELLEVVMTATATAGLLAMGPQEAHWAVDSMADSVADSAAMDSRGYCMGCCTGSRLVGVSVEAPRAGAADAGAGSAAAAGRAATTGQGRRSNVGSLLDHVWLTAPSGAVGLI